MNTIKTTEKDLESFGSYMRFLRRRNGSSRDQLSETADIKYLTLHYWETNKHSPHRKNLDRTLTLLGVSDKERQICYALLKMENRISVAFSDEESYTLRLLWSGLLHRSGLPTRQIAQFLDVSDPVVSRWRSGRRMPALPHQESLLNLMKTPDSTRQFLLSGKPLPYIEALGSEGSGDLGSDDLDAHFSVIDALWQAELDGHLGDEADAIFFALEERLWRLIHKGNSHAPVGLAHCLNVHSNWRGRHGYPDRDKIARAGLSLVSPAIRDQRAPWISLMLQYMSLSDLRQVNIKEHRNFMAALKANPIPSERGILSGVESSLANHYCQLDQNRSIDALIARAYENARFHSEQSGDQGFLINVQQTHSRILLHQGASLAAAKAMPEPYQDPNDRDAYGIADRLLQRVRVFKQLKDSANAQSTLSEAWTLINRYQLDYLAKNARKLERRI